MKIWECYDNLAQQDWAIEGTKIRLSGIRNTPLSKSYRADKASASLMRIFSDSCLDLTDGRTDNSNVIQVWQCSANNANQEWAITIPGTDPDPTLTFTPPPPPPTSTGCAQPTCASCPTGAVPIVTTPPGGCPTCSCSIPAAVPT
jgi:hypothetical protein